MTEQYPQNNTPNTEAYISGQPSGGTDIERINSYNEQITLTDGEFAEALGLAEGLTSQESAELRNISTARAYKHRAKLKNTLDAKTLAQAVYKAIRLGAILLPHNPPGINEPIPKLDPFEVDLLIYIASGLTDNEIAVQTGKNYNTITTWISKTLNKLDPHKPNRHRGVYVALERGIIV
jgi:DNA-binding CsgD family transcriptional regulator